MRWSKDVKITGISEKLFNIAELMQEVSKKFPEILEESDTIKEVQKNLNRETYNLKPKDNV